MARTAGVITVGEEWDATLSLSPQRVLTNDPVTMTVTLSHPGGDTPNYGDFTYSFSAPDPRLDKILQRVKVPTGTRSASFKVPPLPDGDYEIDVSVKKDPKATTSHPDFPEAGITAHANLTAVAHEVEARATVT